MWKRLLFEWAKRKKEPLEMQLERGKIELQTLMEAVMPFKCFTKSQVCSELSTTDRVGINALIQPGLDKGIIEQATEKDEYDRVTQESLTDEEFAKIKPKRGYPPEVFRLTEVGKKAISGSL